jgi:ribA/ribD-fused uncharacterized protein
MHVISRFDGEYFFLSNFYEAPTIFSMNGEKVTMPTGEHAFQAAKCHAMLDTAGKKEYVLSVANAPTPGKAKYLGRSVEMDLPKWETIKIECMREVVWQKFSQHRNLRAELVMTNDAMLVEGNDWNDTFWGRVNGKGYNKLGVILMEVRGFWLWQGRRNEPEMGS